VGEQVDADALGDRGDRRCPEERIRRVPVLQVQHILGRERRHVALGAVLVGADHPVGARLDLHQVRPHRPELCRPPASVPNLQPEGVPERPQVPGRRLLEPEARHLRVHVGQELLQRAVRIVLPGARLAQRLHHDRQRGRRPGQRADADVDPHVRGEQPGVVVVGVERELEATPPGAAAALGLICRERCGHALAAADPIPDPPPQRNPCHPLTPHPVAIAKRAADVCRTASRRYPAAWA